ncbi:protein shisa-like-2A isoform 2-T2 [Morphnus guianensis]
MGGGRPPKSLLDVGPSTEGKPSSRERRCTVAFECWSTCGPVDSSSGPLCFYHHCVCSLLFVYQHEATQQTGYWFNLTDGRLEPCCKTTSCFGIRDHSPLAVVRRIASQAPQLMTQHSHSETRGSSIC